MKRKVFYTIHREKCGLKIEEKSGFDIMAGGRMFNAYRNENGTVYIIDPESGRSVFARNRDELSEVEAIESVREELIENDFVMEFDLECYDVSEDINGNEIDRKKIFWDMLKELFRAGARISIYEDGEMISTKSLDNRLAFLEEIRIQVERDIERELGYE